MKKQNVWVASALTLLLGVATVVPSSAVFGQNTASAKKEKGAAEGRVPAYFAQIGLSKEQRAKVIDVQNSYSDKIDALRKQIAELEGKRDTDVRGVLTDEQKKKLDELVDAAKKKASESRSKGKSESANKPDEAAK